MSVQIDTNPPDRPPYFFIKLMLALGPTSLMLIALVQWFPNTGLGRILTIPLTYLLNLVVILLAFMIAQKLGRRSTRIVWIVAIAITLAITVKLYPQEYQPPVTQQIWDRLNGRAEPES
ncbi:hypothetical protein QWJ34_16420 [Saccharibacillus sp. CPCC 101409]|uniref:hypothetical protein n=1 Tax=Saccharibacillus sp. CPCC 101409 TaxID=3058041 RepID=UPI0026718219|nr:hypothetical protein [Saccharibacillus sp. CPCC 101409]MDO3411352.1 hypothetical protein [Saccharibacillus sp. CPCC 101409]